MAYILLTAAITSGASAAANADGPPGLIREIRLKLSDFVASNRNAIQLSGPALLDYTRRMIGKLDSQSFHAYIAANIAASTAYTTHYLIPVSALEFADPRASNFSIPMNALGEDAYLEVDWNAASDVFSAGAPSTMTLSAVAFYEEMPSTNDFVYYAAELKSNNINFNGTGDQIYEFGSTGILLSMMMQGYNGAYSSSVGRASVISSGGNIQGLYGRKPIFTILESQMIALDEYSFDAPVIDGGYFSNRRRVGTWMKDLLTRDGSNNAFSINSAWDLRKESLGGDKGSLVFSGWANTGYRGVLTQRRIFPPQSDPNANLFRSFV